MPCYELLVHPPVTNSVNHTGSRADQLLHRWAKIPSALSPNGWGLTEIIVEKVRQDVIQINVLDLDRFAHPRVRIVETSRDLLGKRTRSRVPPMVDPALAEQQKSRTSVRDVSELL